MIMAKSKRSSSSSKTNLGGVKVEVDNNSSVNVRAIQNGFIVSESGYTGKGRNRDYYNKEYFQKNNPLKGVAGSNLNNSGRSGSSMKFGGKK